MDLIESNRRLELLAAKLNALPPERFNYWEWVSGWVGGKQDLSCGAQACALGWATTIPELQAQLNAEGQPISEGLYLVRDPIFGTKRKGLVAHHPSGQKNWSAGALVFGLKFSEADYLFTPQRGDNRIEISDEYPVSYMEDGDESDVESGTEPSNNPQFVAAKIRHFIANRDTPGMPWS